ncbi:MAG: glycosyltransferase [Myxococcota bacterium]
MKADKKLKIAMVIDAYDDVRNGCVISTMRFSRLLRQKGHEVIVISTGKPGNHKIVVPEFYPPLFKGIIQRYQMTLGKPDKKIITQALQDVDIVHLHMPFWLESKAATIANKLGIPVVSTFHVQAEHLLHAFNIRSRLAVKLLYKLFLKQIYNKSELIICPSKFAEEEIRRHGFEKPTVVISNGLQPDYCPGDYKRTTELKNKFVLLTVGRLAREKRQDKLIEAVAASKHQDDIQLILVGKGPRKKHLRKLGSKLPNPPLFKFLKPEEVIYYYNISDLYIHAAEVEVECMTALEAMGCGLPVLIASSSKSATSQFALDDRFLYPHRDIQALTRKIDYWFEHPDELQQAEKDYLAKAQEYSIANSADNLESVYYRVCEEYDAK